MGAGHRPHCANRKPLAGELQVLTEEVFVAVLYCKVACRPPSVVAACDSLVDVGEEERS